MGTTYSTTTQNASLPSYLTSGVQTAATNAVNAANMSNPVAGLVQGTAGWGNPAQYGATVATQNLTAYQAPKVSAGYQPYMVGTNYTPQTVSADSVAQYGSPSVSDADISRFQNPYTSGVIQTSLDELNRQLAQTNQASSGQAAQAGAFGGDRAAIVQTENARNANQIAAQTISNLNNQGYSQALTAAQAEAARRLQAGTAQGQLDANVGEANQYAGLQGANLNATNDRANQSATATAQALNATQDRANQSAGLSAANLDLNAANQLNTIGNTYQATQNQALQNQYNAQYRDAMWPITSANQLVSNMASLESGSPKSTTTTAPDGNTLTSATGALTAATGLNSLTGGALTSGIKSLFGSSGGSSVDPSVAGTNVGDQVSSAFNTDASSIPTWDASGDFGFKRGGVVGYAPGGAVGQDDTYVPVSDGVTNAPTDLMAAIWRKRMADQAAQQQPGGFSVTAQAPQQAPQAGLGATAVDPQGSYDDAGYQPTSGGPGMEANLGLAPAAPQQQPSALDQVLSGQPPASIVENGPEQPAQDNDALVQGILEKTLPSASGAAQPQAGFGSSGPVPVLTNSQGPAAGLGGNRVAQSADPAAPMPQGYSGSAPQQGAPPGSDWAQNKLGMSLLSAGLGMMASRSPHFLQGVGEGAQKGVAQLDLMQKQQTDAALKSALYGVKADQVGVNQQRANIYGQRVNDQAALGQDGNEIKRAQLAERTRRNDQLFQTSMARSSHLSGAELQQQLIGDYQKDNPGSTTAEAWAALKNYTPRNELQRTRLGIAQQLADQGNRRLDQADQRQATTQDYRERALALRATVSEDATARGMMFNDPHMTYDKAIVIIRSGRAKNGFADAPPSQNQITQPQRGQGGGQQRLTMQQALALPPGTPFVDENGVARTRH